MIAIPGPGPATVELMCNRCGLLLPVATTVVQGNDLIWPLLAEHGWSGSPFEHGTHWCPACSTSDRRGATPPHPAPAPARWSVEVTRQGPVAVVTPGGDITAAVARWLRSALTEALACSRWVVVELSAARLMDPAGLSALVRAHRAARQRGGALCLASASRFIVTALHTMRLDTTIPVLPDRETAVAWLAARERGEPADHPPAGPAGADAGPIGSTPTLPAGGPRRKGTRQITVGPRLRRRNPPLREGRPSW